jgi:hypothetical protein
MGRDKVLGHRLRPSGARCLRWSALEATVDDDEGGEQSHSRASSSTAVGMRGWIIYPIQTSSYITHTTRIMHLLEDE